MISVVRGNRETFLQSLQHLYGRLRSYTIWLYEDRARWHKDPPVEEFLRTHRRLKLDALPSYQPVLNPQDWIWRQIRFEATTNRWFETLEDIRTTVQETTRSWSQSKVRRLCNMA